MEGRWVAEEALTNDGGTLTSPRAEEIDPFGLTNVVTDPGNASPSSPSGAFLVA